MTTPFDIPLRFESLAGFQPVIRPLADGMRASTLSRCVSCAVIEYLDPTDERLFSSFNLGVAGLGHMLHQWWAHQEFASVSHAVEVPVAWDHGLAHDDVVVYEGKWLGTYEVKTHSIPKPKAPSRENIEQAEVRLRLRERSGALALPSFVVMIGKAGNEGGWVRGPWRVGLTDERRAQIDSALDAASRLLARAGDIDLHDDPELRANGCRRCFPPPRVDASPLTSDLIDKCGRLKSELAAHDTDRKDAAEAKAIVAAQLEAARAELIARLDAGAVYEAIHCTASINARGTLTITPRREVPA